MKKIVVTSGVFLVLLAGALIIGPGFIDWNKHKPRILAQLHDATGHNYKIEGPLELAVLPFPHVSINGLSVATPSTAGDIPLVQLEKAVHGTKVSFKQGKSYGIAGPNLGNVMREIIDLSGTGAVAGSTIYPECAVMIAFTLPRSPILKRRRVGRKWLHVGQLPSLGSATDDVQKGIAQLPADVQNFYLTNYATPLVTEAWSGGAVFASNTDPFTSPDVHNWLEHRQFHR